MTRRGLFAVSTAALVAACSRLSLFNSLTPKDSDSRLAEGGVAYGADPRQRMDVYVPAKPASGPAPVVVFFYGGNWASGDRALYSWVGRALASRGFVTVLPDYRLVPQHRFPDFVNDGAAAVARTRAIAAQYGGDPNRVALMGHSAGAYIAVLLALDPHYLQHAGVDMADIRATVGLAGPYDFYPFDVPASVDAFGQWPDPAQTQPIHFARGDAPPLLLAHGDKDTTVRPRNSTALYDAIRAKGGDVDLKIYPGRDHVDLVLALSKPFRGRFPLLDDVTGFLRTNLQVRS